MKTSALGFVLVFLAAPAAAAQLDVDPRWAGWIGCWQLVAEDERRDGPVPAVAAIDRVRGGADVPAPVDPDRPRLCVAPADSGGVTLTTEARGEVAFEQTLVADGREHPIAGACAGTQRAEWSANGRILFSRADLACEGTSRSGASLTLLAPDGSWLDVEAIRTGAEEGLVVRRYRRVDGAPRPGTRLSLADVQEAAAHVPPAVIEATLVETQASFALRAQQAAALADAGVPDRVIDMVVALSYPERFVVERRAPQQRRAFTQRDPLAPFDPRIDDYWGYWDRWSIGYAPFGYWAPTYADVFFNPLVPAIPGVIIVVPNEGGGTDRPGPPTGAGGGLAVNNLGYTRVRTREPETAAARTPLGVSTGSGTVRTSDPGGSVSSSGDSGGSSSGGSSVSPEGYSGGGSGSGRTAVPR